MSRGTCGTVDPDGKYGCLKRANHTHPTCENAYYKVKWCGDCMEWMCKHIAFKSIKAYKAKMENCYAQL